MASEDEHDGGSSHGDFEEDSMVLKILIAATAAGSGSPPSSAARQAAAWSASEPAAGTPSMPHNRRNTRSSMSGLGSGCPTTFPHKGSPSVSAATAAILTYRSEQQQIGIIAGTSSRASRGSRTSSAPQRLFANRAC